MEILATIRENDTREGESRPIFLGYEKCPGTDFPIMYLGIVDNMGVNQDDRIFCFVRTPDEVLSEIEKRWSHFVTFEYYT